MEKIREIVKKSANDYGLIVIEVNVGKDSIEAVLYSPSHDVNIGELEAVTREIQSRLSEIGLEGAYSVGLSSPGMDRILKSERELNILKGKLVKISVIEGEKLKTDTGILQGTDGKFVIVQKDDGTVREELAKVASVRLWDELFEKGKGGGKK